MRRPRALAPAPGKAVELGVSMEGPGESCFTVGQRPKPRGGEKLRPHRYEASMEMSSTGLLPRTAWHWVPTRGSGSHRGRRLHPGAPGRYPQLGSGSGRPSPRARIPSTSSRPNSTAWEEKGAGQGKEIRWQEGEREGGSPSEQHLLELAQGWVQSLEQSERRENCWGGGEAGRGGSQGRHSPVEPEVVL